MARKRTKVSEKMLFMWFMLAGIILLLAPESMTDRFQLALAHVLYLPGNTTGNISLAATKPTRSDKETDDQDFARYESYIANLELQLQQKNEKIEELAGIRDRWNCLEGAILILADLIQTAGGIADTELVINRGKNDGVTENCFVLGDNSIIGVVSQASARTTIVKLFTDKNVVIPVGIGQLEKDMLLQGAGENTATIDLVPVKYKINQGDMVYVKKTPGLLDVPMVIGTVDTCGRDPQKPSLWDINVKPICDISQLRSVAVIVMNPQ